MTTPDKPLVLIVDDEPEILDLMAMHVAAVGMRIIKSINGQEALEILDKSMVDLVVSDLVMPRKSGMSLLQKMSRDQSDIPFVFITGFASKESMIQALKLGAFDYVEKPFDPASVRAIITEAVRVGRERRALKLSQEGIEQLRGPTPEQNRRLVNLRSLREGTPSAEADGDAKAMFVNESLAQIKHCLNAVKDLAQADQRAWESAYLFRVMQTIKQAAQAVGAKDVELLAAAGETCFSLLRIKQQAYDPAQESFLVKVVETLRQAIEEFPKGKNFRGVEVVLPELDEYCVELSGIVGLEEAV